MQYNWTRNPWTGHDLARVTDSRRLVRQEYAGAPPLYYAEEWGDYSLSYPIRGAWCETPSAALTSLRRRLRGASKTR